MAKGRNYQMMVHYNLSCDLSSRKGRNTKAKGAIGVTVIYALSDVASTSDYSNWIRVTFGHTAAQIVPERKSSPLCPAEKNPINDLDLRHLLKVCAHQQFSPD